MIKSNLRAILLLSVLALAVISITRPAESQTPIYDHKSMHGSACRYSGYPHPIGQPAGVTEYHLERIGEHGFATMAAAWPQYGNPITMSAFCPIPRDVVINTNPISALIVSIVDASSTGQAECRIVNVREDATLHNYGTLKNSGISFASGYTSLVWNSSGLGTGYAFGTAAVYCTLSQNVSIIGYRWSEGGGGDAQ